MLNVSAWRYSSHSQTALGTSTCETEYESSNERSFVTPRDASCRGRGAYGIGLCSRGNTDEHDQRTREKSAAETWDERIVCGLGAAYRSGV